jgi:predicted outer membrane repeat protein
MWRPIGARLAAGVAAVTLLLPRPATGTTRHVPSTDPTIQAGLAAAQPGDTVRVAGGQHDEHDLQMANGVVLRSATGSADCAVIDACHLGRVLRCDSAISSRRLARCLFDANVASYNGGAIGCEYSTLHLEGTATAPLAGCILAGAPAGQAVHCEDATCAALRARTFAGRLVPRLHDACVAYRGRLRAPPSGRRA